MLKAFFQEARSQSWPPIDGATIANERH